MPILHNVATSPYVGLPRRQIWKRAVAATPPEHLDPQDGAKFGVSRSDRIASAGSCFARHVAERLRVGGFTYFVTEPGPTGAAPGWLAERHYGTYSARFGDVYTTLQLLQLVRRSVGSFVPREPAWEHGGGFVDPFRPRVEPDGFASPAALEADRAVHLAAVRRMLVESDVFVFTLGLTEGWCSRDDGAAFPLCPGAGYGTFDPERYAFRNLDVDENVRNLEAALEIAWTLNPRLRVILTVSPVPLAATMEPCHVVQATTYSKSVLRVAAETVRRRHDLVDYFASYELIAGPFSGGGHYTADRREIAPASVDRAMRCFFASFAPPSPQTPPQGALPRIDLAPPPDAPEATVTGRDPCDDAYLAAFLEGT